MRLQLRLCLTLLHDTRPFGSCCSAERPHLSGGWLPRQNVKCHTLNLHFSVIAFVKKKNLNESTYSQYTTVQRARTILNESETRQVPVLYPYHLQTPLYLMLYMQWKNVEGVYL